MTSELQQIADASPTGHIKGFERFIYEAAAQVIKNQEYQHCDDPMQEIMWELAEMRDMDYCAVETEVDERKYWDVLSPLAYLVDIAFSQKI